MDVAEVCVNSRVDSRATNTILYVEKGEFEKTIYDAVKDLKSAFEKGLLPNSLTDERYFNIKRMNNIQLK